MRDSSHVNKRLRVRSRFLSRGSGRALHCRLRQGALIASMTAGLVPCTALGAANEHGQLFFHARPDLEYSTTVDPSGQSDLQDCAEASVTLAVSPDTVIWYVMAAFPPQISPRVTSVEFGIDYDDTRIQVTDYGFNEGATIYRTQDFPGSGSSVRIDFSEPISERLFEIGWFAGAAAAEPSLFQFDSNYTARFWSTVRPTAVERFGSLGFGLEGEFVCNPTFACCLQDGSCQILPDFACEEQQGLLLSETTCSPDPCLGVVAACCLPGEPEECVVQSQFECDSAGGYFMGLNSVCSPGACDIGICCLEGENPEGCEILRAAECVARGGTHFVDEPDPELCFTYCCCGPTIQSSWGTVKTRFRP